ncbi:MAG: F0F1 ATP synthase subunit epsilon [Pseudomonadota bacterium]|jgi:F-type H+-transporting ATPase subunit epsilon|nr:F0F1 ATP synthase subunit epsilon [Pseudomonadota bacterium]
MATMQVEIVSAEEDIFSGEAELVIAPAEMGDVGVMPQHTPLITRLRPGEVRLQTQGEEERFYFVSGGILEVQPHVVTVLADTAIRAKDLDEAQAREAKQRAEEALADKQSDMDYATAQARLVEAAAQLRMLEDIRRRRR